MPSDPQTIYRALVLEDLERRDTAGEVITTVERARAGSGLEEEGDEGFLQGRVSRLWKTLTGGHNAPYASPPAPRWGLVLGGFVVGAFLVGLIANQLSGLRFINILSLAFLGVLLWNIVVYLLIGVMALTGLSRGRKGFVGRLIRWLGKGRENGDEDRPVFSESLSSASKTWRDAMTEVWSSSGAGVFHASAAALALGQIAGMYSNGLFRQYFAGWESTFLDAAAIEKVVSWIYTPAAWLTRQPIDGLESLDVGSGAEGGDAGRWIHLMAATHLLVVILPRLVLAALSFVRSRTQKRRAQNDLAISLKPTITRWRGLAGGGGTSICILPYPAALPSTGEAALRDLVTRVWGGESEIVVGDPIPYGDEDTAGEFVPSDASALLVAVPMTGTPEAETYGEVLRALREARPGTPVFSVLDGHRFVEKFTSLPEFADRFSERLANWAGVLGESAGDLPVLGAVGVTPAPHEVLSALAKRGGTGDVGSSNLPVGAEQPTL